MSDLSPTLAFRTKRGTFSGPFLNEAQLTGLLRLYRDQVSPSSVEFPDLSPVIYSLHRLISDGVADQSRRLQGFIIQQQELEQERRLAKSYELLFGKWNYASSIVDQKKKADQWDKVVDKACDVLYDLREAMPIEKSINHWGEALAYKVQQIGRMYTEALLFIIYGRASYEPLSLVYDPRPRQYIHEIKAIISSYLDGENKVNLLLSAALHETKHYKKVGILAGFNTQTEADAFLFKKIKAINPVRISDPNSMMNLYMSDVQDAYSRTIRSECYTHSQWMVFCALWELHRQVSLLESLLDALEEQGAEPDSKASRETHEIITAVLQERFTLLDR
ncbi:TPA: hypothetical protein ACN7EP_001303 [Klebsiella pneumoniae]